MNCKKLEQLPSPMREELYHKLTVDEITHALFAVLEKPRKSNFPPLDMEIISYSYLEPRQNLILNTPEDKEKAFVNVKTVIFTLKDLIELLNDRYEEALKTQYRPWTEPLIGGSYPSKESDPCDTCPNKGGPKDVFGNPVAGDSPCQWCPHYKYRVTCSNTGNKTE